MEFLTVKDWLAAWDAGQIVASIEMGGIGPGYEQCIQITAAEIMRWLEANKPDPAFSEWETTRDEIYQDIIKNPACTSLGLSYSQWGAALSLATSFYKNTPDGVMKMPDMRERVIMVRKNFPSTHPLDSQLPERSKDDDASTSSVAETVAEIAVIEALADTSQQSEFSAPDTSTPDFSGDGGSFGGAGSNGSW